MQPTTPKRSGKPDEMPSAGWTCVLLAACYFSAIFMQHVLTEKTEILDNRTTSRKTELAITKLTHSDEEYREHNYGTTTQKRKKIKKTIATGQGTKSSDFSEEFEETNNPFLVFEDDIDGYGRTIAASDVDDDRRRGVTTVVPVTLDHNDFETKGDTDEDLSDENDYDTTNAANENCEPSHDIAEKLAFKQYRAQTNFIPRTQNEKYAQLLASYRFMTLAKGNDWTDFDEGTHDYTRVTETIDHSTDLDAVEDLINPRRQKILEYVTRETYLAFRKKVDNMSIMGPGSVLPAPTTPASAVFGSPPPQCPKKKITSLAPGAKMSVRKPRRGYNDYSGAFDDSGIPLEIRVVSGSVLQLVEYPQHTTCQVCATHDCMYSDFKLVWCEKLQKCTNGSDYNRPLLSGEKISLDLNLENRKDSRLHSMSFDIMSAAERVDRVIKKTCHFQVNQSMDPVAVPTTDYILYNKWF